MPSPEPPGRASRAPCAVLLLALFALPALPQSLAPLASAYRAFEAKDWRGALAAARQVRAPQLADYAASLAGSAAFELKDYDTAIVELERVWKHEPRSPLFTRAVTLAARSYLAAGRPEPGIALLRKHYTELPQPEAGLLLAQSYDAAGDGASAADFYQRVYYEQPATSEAADAGTALERLKQSLGERFPPAMPQAMLSRATRLLHAGEATRARSEFTALVPQLAGPERDLARVRACEALYTARRNREAFDCLSALQVSAADADAERLYFMHAAARRLERETEMLAAVEQLARYPQTTWRLQALVSAGNHFLLRNDPGRWAPYFRACYEAFPAAPQAAYCHWKLAFRAYLERDPEAAALLRQHVLRFPASPNRGAALYFLARNAERAGSPGLARSYYSALEARLPNSFYASLARERLRDRRLSRTAAQSTPVLEESVWPDPPRFSFAENGPARERLERARLLASVSLYDWAEAELRFGARQHASPLVMALELARMADQRGSPQDAIRSIKLLASDYLRAPLESAPDTFWRLAFPLPYRQALESISRVRSLDPYLMAALIRQESEFDPNAVSPARAYGLTQVLPSTGLQLSRRLGIRRFRSSMLFQPDINLKLGSYYLRSLLDQLGGRWEAALASYNAGKSRVLGWLGWAAYDEPAEFIENIPISETRTYVQTVLRNADIYRRLYGGVAGVKVAKSEAGNGR